MTATSPQTDTQLVVIEWAPALMIGMVGLGLAGLVVLDTGLRGLTLFALGGALGAVFIGFQYGFASAWRRFLVAGETMGLAAHFLLIGLCALLFIPAAGLGLAATGSLAPVSVSLAIGAFIFGIGMQLANGCGSGVLFSFGGGSGRMLVALPFFILGSLLGSFLLPTALDWGSLGQVAIAGGAGETGRLLVNIGLIAATGAAFYVTGRRRGQALPRELVIGSLVIAALCWLVFIISGNPWGITFGFTLWGAKIAALIGVPVGDFTFWQWAGPRRALTHSVLADVSSLMDVGMVIGAGLLAAIGGGLRRQSWPSSRQLVAAALGGILMGIGARLAFGCNIGAFLAGIASGSLHGWIWFVMAMAGSWAGIRWRPSFGLSR
ncbi:MAG: YeeE/YedE family protein [Alphaproteobacteria bacterium]|nr:YeeE/YedE family protein [Alphaproteobacteria bacterium]